MHLQFGKQCPISAWANSRKIIIVIIFIFLSFITGYSQIDLLKEVIKEADKTINEPLLKMTSISDNEENSIGAETQKKILNDYKVVKTNKFNIADIFKKIKANVTRKKIKYEIKVLEDNEFNAFAIAGGKNFLFTGLIKDLDTEEEIAFVIAHEIAHNELKHCIKKIQYSATASKVNPLFANIVQVAYNIYQTPFSQDQEYEADKLGVKLMILAGYNKEGAISFFTKLEKMERKFQQDNRDPINDFISSHPTAEKRKLRISKM